MSLLMRMLNKKNIVSMPKLITHNTCDDYDATEAG